MTEEKKDNSDMVTTRNKKKGLEIEGYPVEGISIGGQETCVIFPSLKIAFDIGRCPQRAISQEFLFISHGHMDHIGGLPMYVATRGLYKLKPPTVIVPVSIKENVEKLFEVHRAMDYSELNHRLVGLDVGEEFQLRKDLKVKAFKTYHSIPSQGYIVYSVKQKLKQEYIGLSGNEIRSLKLSGVEITNTVTSSEVAFTGDTMSDFIADPNNTDALKARILVMEILAHEDALIRIKDIALKHPEELKLHKLAIIGKLCERISDEDKVVRETLYNLLKTVIFPGTKEDIPGPFISLIMAYISNAMTHLAVHIRLMAFTFFGLVVQHYPSSFLPPAEEPKKNQRFYNQRRLGEPGSVRSFFSTMNLRQRAFLSESCSLHPCFQAFH